MISILLLINFLILIRINFLVLTQEQLSNLELLNIVAIFSCSAAIQKMISLASRQEIAQDTANSYLTCMDVNTDSDDVLYKSKLNIDGLKTCEGRSSLGGQTLHLRQQSSHQQQDF